MDDMGGSLSGQKDLIIICEKASGSVSKLIQAFCIISRLLDVSIFVSHSLSYINGILS